MYEVKIEKYEEKKIFFTKTEDISIANQKYSGGKPKTKSLRRVADFEDF